MPAKERHAGPRPGTGTHFLSCTQKKSKWVPGQARHDGAFFLFLCLKKEQNRYRVKPDVMLTVAHQYQHLTRWLVGNNIRHV